MQCDVSGSSAFEELLWKFRGFRHCSVPGMLHNWA